MKKWPLNSTTLFATTHNKLRKAADGIGTPVATCMINKWTTKINEKEIYNGKFLSRARRKKKRDKKNEDGCSSYHPWKLSPLSTKEPRKRRISPRTKPGYTFTLPLDDSIIPSPYDHVRLLELSLKPSSCVHFLYQIYCIEPVGFGLICLTVKNLPKTNPTISAVCGKNLCASENNNQTW